MNKELPVDPNLSDEAVRQIEAIRELRNAAPFVPFSIVVDDGRKLVVDRSFLIGIAPSRREIMFARSPVDFERIASGRIRGVVRDAG